MLVNALTIRWLRYFHGQLAHNLHEKDNNQSQTHHELE